MVALHNKKLTTQDVFLGILWTERQVIEFRRGEEIRLINEGYSHIEAILMAAELTRKRLHAQPNLRARQNVMQSIRPVKYAHSLSFSEEEIDWLLEKLEGVNDPIGVDILDKIRAKA